MLSYNICRLNIALNKETYGKTIILKFSTKFLFILYSARALRTTTQYIIIIYLVTYVQRNSFTDIYIKYIFNSY